MIEGQLIRVPGWPLLQGRDDQKFLGDGCPILHGKVVGDTQSKGGLRRLDRALSESTILTSKAPLSVGEAATLDVEAVELRQPANARASRTNHTIPASRFFIMNLSVFLFILLHMGRHGTCRASSLP